MEGQRPQPGRVGFERAAGVLAIEVGGVGVTGADHAFVALTHNFGMGQLGVGDGDKLTSLPFLTTG